ncbi:hypothetical protein GEMRC1_003637 [Eukaryota sp. GEM-RC1]
MFVPGDGHAFASTQISITQTDDDVLVTCDLELIQSHSGEVLDFKQFKVLQEGHTETKDWNESNEGDNPWLLSDCTCKFLEFKCIMEQFDVCVGPVLGLFDTSFVITLLITLWVLTKLKILKHFFKITWFILRLLFIVFKFLVIPKSLKRIRGRSLVRVR